MAHQARTEAIGILIAQIKDDAELILSAARSAEARISDANPDGAIADLIGAEAAIDGMAGLYRTTMSLHRKRPKFQ